MKVFISEDNLCAQNLLKLVSHGNAIIAELLRLKDHIPPVLCLATKDEQQKYADVVLDFGYFKISDIQEREISNESHLQELDDEIKENNLELITRFYLAFESIYQYVVDLNLFLEQLSDGLFIQQTLETVLQDVEGKQLLCECLYLYGAMLLTCDFYIPGPVRERLLVAFYRYSTSQSQSNVDDVCKLLRDTGFSNNNGKKPTNYPQEYFSRVPVQDMFVNVVLGKLRSEDIYNQIPMYPIPEHRSTALATQATILFVCLFFSPHMLMNEVTQMREIVDKYFPDNWVISVYMGLTLSVPDLWDSMRAAKAALTNTLNIKQLKEISMKHGSQINKLLSQTNNILKGNALTEEKLMDNINKMLGILRECNVTLRWLMLHTTKPIYNEFNKKTKNIRETVIKESKFNPSLMLDLLMNTAEMELKVRQMFKTLLETKNEKWKLYKTDAHARLMMLSEFFSENKPIINVVKNDKLKLWFSNMAKQVNTLSDDITSTSTKKIAQLIQALEEVQEFHSLQANTPVVQGLSDARQCLRNALRVSSLREESLVTLETVADVSYAWCIVDTYTVLMQSRIKENPSITSRLRALFLKLANAMEIPLLRINQAHSEDLVSVSQYYSTDLVSYIGKVLQVIPEMVFSVLAKIIHLQTWCIKELPTRVDKDQLREYSQLQQRMEVAKLTHSASVFTKGILMMRTTLIGVVRIDPAELLELGLRRELAHHVRGRFEELLDPQGKNKSQSNISTADLFKRLQVLAESMDGYKRSLEYIQDYVNIHGLKIWQEEFSGIINESVEKEVNQRKGVVIISPSASFMGSLAREILKLVDTRSSFYIYINAAWYENKTHKETVNMKTFLKLYEALGPTGLHGLHKLYSFMIKNRLSELLHILRATVAKDASWNAEILYSCNAEQDHNNHDPTKILKNYQQLIVKGGKLWPSLCEIMVSVGTIQTLCKHICYQLNTSCKFDSGHLESSLRAMNDSLLKDVKDYAKDSSKPKPSLELLHTLDEYLVHSGIADPYDKIYVMNRKLYSSMNSVNLIFLMIISQLPKLQFISNIDELVSRRAGDYIDGHELSVGVLTLLNQHNRQSAEDIVKMLSHYTVATVSVTLNSKTPEVSTEAVSTFKFLQHFCYISNIPFTAVENIIPVSILILLSDHKQV